MHQPLIPAGGGDLHTAAVISNLKYMMDNPGIGDNHNAAGVRWCYKRMGEFIPQLDQRRQTAARDAGLLGRRCFMARAMGLDDVFDNLKRITLDPAYRGAVEWLGAPWGHAVAPSTPVQDFRLHVRAWQHHFAAIFGLDALGRVRGFSPPEMALAESSGRRLRVRTTLKECGYQLGDGPGTYGRAPRGRRRDPEARHVPHRLVARNSRGETQAIIAIIKTQGSDTKLVAQMQPYYEAKGLSRVRARGSRAAARHPDRRRRERRRDDERVPAQIHGGHAGSFRIGHSGGQRERIS